MAKESTSPRKEAETAARGGRKSGEENTRRTRTEANRISASTPTSGAGSTPAGSGESGASGSSTPQQNDGNSGQKPVTVNQANPQPEKSTDKEFTAEDLSDYVASLAKKDPKELSVEELNVLKENATDPEERQKYEDMINLRNLPGDGKVPEAGKIEKTDDPDAPKEDDDKFDIQQGDFIEFLMKDIVLASAAWAGKKVSGQIGLLTYRGLSWMYHTADDKLFTPAGKEISEAWDNLKKNTKEAFRTVEQYQIKDTLSSKDDTTNFAHELIKGHNKVIDDALKSPKRIEAFGRFATAIVNGKLKEGTYNQNGHAVWFDKETRTTIPLEGKSMQDLIKMVQETSQAIDASDRPAGEKAALKDLAAKDFSVIVGTYTLLESQKDIFVSNMTTAALLQAKAEDKGYQYSKEELEAMKNEAAISFFLELRKIKNGQSQFKTVEEFLEASGKAVQTSYENLDKGRYMEKGKMPPVNKDLVLLKNLNTNTANQDLQSLRDEALSSCNDMAKLEERRRIATDSANAAEAAQRAHEQSRRSRDQRGTNGNNGQENSGQRTPTKPKLNEGASR